jgi:hypothetical protein
MGYKGDTMVFAVGLTLLRCTRYGLNFRFAHLAILSGIYSEQAAVNPNVVLNMNAVGCVTRP